MENGGVLKGVYFCIGKQISDDCDQGNLLESKPKKKKRSSLF